MEILFSQLNVPCLQDKKVQLKLLHPGKYWVKFLFHKKVELFHKLELEILSHKEAKTFRIYYHRKTISFH